MVNPLHIIKGLQLFLAPLLAKSFNSLLKQRLFRPETPMAIIARIPKLNTDITTWLIYRSISLLNIDGKILEKILTFRSNPIRGSLGQKDQEGFIPIDRQLATYAGPIFWPMSPIIEVYPHSSYSWTCVKHLIHCHGHTCIIFSNDGASATIA